MDELLDAFADVSQRKFTTAELSSVLQPTARGKRPRKMSEEVVTSPNAQALVAAERPHHGSGRGNLGASVVRGIEAATVRGSSDKTYVAGVFAENVSAGPGGTVADNKEGSEEAAGQSVDGAPETKQDKNKRQDDSFAGEALRNVLLRGEIDDTKTTAPAGMGPVAGGEATPPARVYPFTLDPFQQRAIECLERNESVLVSAHTSAGKTVVAEYAIAMGLRDRQRVIYTSPIKALSNQKYRDFYEEFSDVGLMTGDITINPNASVLVMTTEILRSMLYRGSEVMREVKWVVFDEVHYMRDKERGVVWEESIILLPHKVRFVFLSATIPNACEFAEWVSKIHHQTCHVVYTDYRPTPLQHFIFPAGGDSVFLVVDEKGRFREDNFAAAMAVLGSSGLEDAVGEVVGGGAGKRGSEKKMGRGRGGQGDLLRIIKMVMERKFDPVIVFSFSKRECEKYALQLSSLDFSNAEEKTLIEEVFRNAMDSLSDDDKKLPQIESILPLLRRGVGIHHGGLLPILKEVIEILFQESLLKILFATETFSMGINMPARTVMFTASRKFDGTDFRWVSPGEYIQMSGRAGRRGLDDRGIVIQMLDEKMEPGAAKDILRGSMDPLNSAFHLGYNMLLNLLRLEGGDPERLMALSFYQFQLERAAPALEAEAQSAEEEANAAAAQLGGEGEVDCLAAAQEYTALANALSSCDEAMAAIVSQPAHAVRFLQPGRLVFVKEMSGGRDWGWGLVAGYSKRAPPGTSALSSPSAPSPESSAEIVVDVFLRCCSEGPEGGKSGSPTGASASVPRPTPATPEAVASGKTTLQSLPVLLPCLNKFSSIRVFMPRDLRSAAGRGELGDSLKEVSSRFPKGPPLLDPIEDMGVDGSSSSDYSQLSVKRTGLLARMEALPLHNAEDKPQKLRALGVYTAARARAVELRGKVQATQALAQRDVLRRMKRVLRRLGHLSQDNVVLMKGRVAAEVNSADELLVTELVFNGVFNDLDAGQSAALLSALVYTEKKKDEKEGEGGPPLREELAAPLRTLQDAARRIASVSTDCKIPLDATEYVDSFNPGMMEMVYAWVKGARFVDIAAMTKEFEGTIIRVIRRLEELTRQLADAAKAIGEEALEAKFKDASSKMRRDIVFAASLYI